MAITIIAKLRKGIASPASAGGGPASGWCNGSEYPSVSVIISAFNEEKYIGKKIENCLSLDYPGDKIEILIGSDGSQDRTNEIIEEYRERGNRGIRPLINQERRGKPSTINTLVETARGDILFFTDARQEIARDALKELVKNFQDPEIGCVSGELVYHDTKTGITAAGIGTYWNYEKYLREMESIGGSMIGATGAIYACRRSLFTPLPENIILDDMYTPLSIVQHGYRTVFERNAVAYDVFAETPRDEHRRKKRTLSGNYQIFFRMPSVLNPLRSKLAFQIISHKLLRLLVPFFMIMLFASNLFLLSLPFYGVFFVVQSTFYAVAFGEAVFRRHINRLKRGLVSKLLGIPYLFCLLNFSAMMGLLEFLFKAHGVKWEKAVN